MIELNWEKILDNRPFELKQKSQAMELLELAVDTALKGGCNNTESVLKWITDISERDFMDVWCRVFSCLESDKYFNEVHGGYDKFTSSRGTYFLRVCGGDEQMFLNRLRKIISVFSDNDSSLR